MSWSATPIDPQLRAQIVALRATGASFHRIAAELNRHGLSTALGGRWYGATVHRVFATLHKERTN
jgi:hypothetical protein